MRLDRRSFLKASLSASAGVAAGLTFGVPGGNPARAAEAVPLQAMWWGSNDRTRRTVAVADLFHKQHPDISVTGQSISGNAYWTKLATEMAGQDVADIFQLEPNTIADYSKRGACMALDEFVPDTLKVEDFGKKILQLTTINGKLYGIGLGLNSFCMFYDEAVFKKIGLKPPTEQTTWKDYADLAVEVTKAVGKSHYWGGPYGARYQYVLDAWMRQRGKSLFSAEGGLGFGIDDAKEWYAYWEDLRKRGGTVTPDVQTQDQDTIESNSLALGNSAMGMAYSNEMIGFQLLTKNTLGITMLPREKAGGPSGHYYRPALIWSVGVNSKHGKAAAEFISFFVNDVQAGKILGCERGVPMSPKVRAAILPDLTPTEQATVKYINLLQDQVGDYPAPAPLGATEYDINVIRTTADKLAFGKVSIAEAAQELVSRAKTTLRAG